MLIAHCSPQGPLPTISSLINGPLFIHGLVILKLYRIHMRIWFCTFYNAHNWMLQEECVQNWRRSWRQQQQQRQQQKRNNITSNHNSYPAKQQQGKQIKFRKSPHIHRAAIDTPAVQKAESEIAENCHQRPVFFLNRWAHISSHGAHLQRYAHAN